MRGGVPAEARTLIAGLKARGHVVALASHGQPEVMEKSLHFPISLPVRDALGGEVGHALEAFQPDFVHVLSMSSRGVAKLAPVLRRYRWALTIHSLPPCERKLTGWHGSERLHYEARALRFLANSLAWRWVLCRGMAPQVVVHSAFVEDIVVRYGCDRDRVRMIWLPFFNAASPPASRAVSDSPLLVTVGGYAHTKGQHDLVKALPALLQTFPRLRCQLIGEVRDDSYLVYLRALAQRLGVDDHLLITPNLSQADKQAALEAADLYVQPSHEEGFCLAYAEAAAVVPRLVGADTGAIAAISSDDAGARVVAVRDPDGMAVAVRELLLADLPADHMAQRAKRLSERFSEFRYLQLHERLYGETR